MFNQVLLTSGIAGGRLLNLPKKHENTCVTCVGLVDLCSLSSPSATPATLVMAHIHCQPDTQTIMMVRWIYLIHIRPNHAYKIGFSMFLVHRSYLCFNDIALHVCLSAACGCGCGAGELLLPVIYTTRVPMNVDKVTKIKSAWLIYQMGAHRSNNTVYRVSTGK